MEKNEVNYKEEDEIDLKMLFFYLLPKWWIFLMVTVLSGAIAFGYTFFFVPLEYEAKSMLFILEKSTSLTSLANLQAGESLTQDFIIIAKSNEVIDNAISKIEANQPNTLDQKQNEKFTREEILEMLSVTNEEDTRILTIKVTSTSPQDAAVIANAVSEATADQMASIMKTDPPTTVERAEVPKTYSSPNFIKNALIGAVAGFILTLVVFVAMYIMNDKIITEEDVEKYLGVPIVGTIPDFSKKM